MSSEWKTKSFGDLVDFISAKAKAEDANPQTYVSTENMAPNFGGVQAAATLPGSGSVTKFNTDDTLFSNIRTYFKKVWRAEFNGLCSNDVLVFRSKDQRVLLPGYLHNLCRWERFTEFSVRTSKGAKMPRGDKDALVQFPIELPPVEKQLSIVEVLDSLDDRITLLRETNATLEAITQALFKSWFVDFDPVRAKMDGRTPEGMDAATAALFPDGFETSKLGEVPRGWKIAKFEDFVQRLPVGKKFDQKTAKADGVVPILDQGKSGVIGFHDEDPGVRASLDEPVVVFANHTCYMRLITHDFSAIQNVLPFKGKGIDTVWAYFATKGRVKFSEYKGHWPDFTIEKAVVPSPCLGEAFRSVVDPLIRRVRLNDIQRDSLASLRDTLLPRLISGQLRLPDAEMEATTA